MSRFLSIVVLAAALFLTTKVASGQEFNLTFDLSIAPSPPTSSSDTVLNFALPNFGVAVGSTLDATIDVDGSSISVLLAYVAPQIPPGGLGLPAAFFPSDNVTLGRLAPGDYKLTAWVPNGDGGRFNSAPLAFTVVPEPNLLIIGVIAISLCALRRISLTTRCS
jgi:hypothetical protein